MPAFQPNWLPFALGAVPHPDAAGAWKAIRGCFREIPFWPQLPQRSYLESMYAQFSERFPGIRFDQGRIYVDRERDLNPDLERLYLAYLEGDLEYGYTGKDHADALARLREGEFAVPPEVVALKGQITGPISLGLTIVDRNQRPVLYDEVLADAVGKHLRMKAAWQERELARLAPQTIVLLDEPYMASFGSAFVSLPRELVIGLLEEVFAGLAGLKGVHCCGNTEWPILLSTSADIISLDAYDYAESLARYPEQVSHYLERGGVIAWGIVPAGPTAESETATSLADRLEAAMERLVAEGVDRDALRGSGLISPSCGLGALEPALADRIFELTVAVSAEIRRRFGPAPAASSEQAETPA